jgi:hypothetical protein
VAPAGCTLLQAFVFHAVVGTWDWERCVEAARQLLAEEESHREFEDGLLDYAAGASPEEQALLLAATAAQDGGVGAVGRIGEPVGTAGFAGGRGGVAAGLAAGSGSPLQQQQRQQKPWWSPFWQAANASGSPSGSSPSPAHDQHAPAQPRPAGALPLAFSGRSDLWASSTVGSPVGMPWVHHSHLRPSTEQADE